MPEPGQRQLLGPRPAADRVGRLEDPNRPPGPGQRDRRGQPVGAGPDDDGVEPPPRAPRSSAAPRCDRIQTPLVAGLTVSTAVPMSSRSMVARSSSSRSRPPKTARPGHGRRPRGRTAGRPAAGAATGSAGSTPRPGASMPRPRACRPGSHPPAPPGGRPRRRRKIATSTPVASAHAIVRLTIRSMSRSRWRSTATVTATGTVRKAADAGIHARSPTDAPPMAVATNPTTRATTTDASDAASQRIWSRTTPVDRTVRTTTDTAPAPARPRSPGTGCRRPGPPSRTRRPARSRTGWARGSSRRRRRSSRSSTAPIDHRHDRSRPARADGAATAPAGQPARGEHEPRIP